MSFVRRAAFEHFWQSSADTRKPLVQKQIEPIRSRLEKALETDPSIIVEKVRYTSHPESQIEIVCTWVGLDPSQEAAEAAVKGLWTPEILAAEEEVVSFDPQEDLFYLLFACNMPESRFFTGKVLIRV
jgi:hypothetical protein